MKVKKPDKCIKAMCGGICDLNTVDTLYDLGYEPQDCPYYRYNPSIYIINKNNSQKRELIDE